RNHFPFNFINKALRTEDHYSLYKLRYFIINLSKQLKSIYDENIEFYQDIFNPYLTVYRGLTLDNNDIQQLQQSIGKYISTNGFLSTSLKREVAELFVANVLFIINISTKSNKQIYAYIAQWSKIPDEEEILFDLNILFQINDIHNDGQKWIVSITAVEQNENLIHDVLNRKLELNQINIDKNVYDKSYTIQLIKYFENLLKFSDSTRDDNETADILIALSEAYSRDGQIDLALKCAIKAYHLSAKFNGISWLVPFSLRSIAEIYEENQDYNEALIVFSFALDTVHVSDVEQIEELHYHIGKIFFIEQNYHLAYKHFQQSLEYLHITDRPLYLLIADRYDYVGQVYEKLIHYNKAIEYYNKSLQMKMINLPLNHLSYQKNDYRFAYVYYLMKRYDLCYEYSVKALSVNEHEEIVVHANFKDNIT
ncbi:unnamed protein product, partial [Didymodactylos carnosus]